MELVDGPNLAQQLQAAQRQEDFSDALVVLGRLAFDEFIFFQAVDEAGHVAGFVAQASLSWSEILKKLPTLQKFK